MLLSQNLAKKTLLPLVMQEKLVLGAWTVIKVLA